MFVVLSMQYFYSPCCVLCFHLLQRFQGFCVYLVWPFSAQGWFFVEILYLLAVRCQNTVVRKACLRITTSTGPATETGKTKIKQQE